MAIAIIAPTVVIGADDPSCGNSTAQVTTTPPAPAAAATTSASQVDPATDTSDLAPGMRIFIDPETGQIGVPSVLPALTPEELAEIQPLQPPVETVMPDGSVMLELNGNCQDYFTIQMDPNGQPVTRCVQDPKTVLETTPAAPQREDR
jgi:hypothetical protein